MIVSVPRCENFKGEKKCFYLELLNLLKGKIEFSFFHGALKTLSGPMYDFYVMQECDLVFFPVSFWVWCAACRLLSRSWWLVLKLLAVNINLGSTWLSISFTTVAWVGFITLVLVHSRGQRRWKEQSSWWGCLNIKMFWASSSYNFSAQIKISWSYV